MRERSDLCFLFVFFFFFFFFFAVGARARAAFNRRIFLSLKTSFGSLYLCLSVFVERCDEARGSIFAHLL